MASRKIRKKLTIFEPLSRKTVENVFKQHIQPGRILELGSDVAEDGMSFLGRMASPEYHNRMIYTDLTSTRKNVKVLNVTQLESQLKKGSHTNIVAQCVLDTISREHLPSIVNGLFHALKPKGKVIIISDLFFDQSPLIGKHATDSNLMLVDVVNGNLGVKLIQSSDLFDRATKMGERFVNFLHSLMALPIEERFNFMQYIHVTKSYLFYVLDNLCEKDKYEFIDHKLSFTGDLSRAFEQHKGFKIIENGYHTEEASGRNRQFINSLSLDVRASTYIESKNDRSLPYGTAKISATCYLFVAEKNK